MKIVLFLTYTCAVLTNTKVSSKAIESPYNVISLDDLSESDRATLGYLNSHLPRPKRSGSSDILSALKTTISQGIKSKLSLIARSSAAASASFSKSSSSGSSGGDDHSHGHYYPHDHHHHHHTDHYEHPYHEDKSYDFWQLKKSILNTLLQAVKAIKGGVIALKGQLIKGSGYLVSAKGKLLKAKGEAITNLGKNIAANAVVMPHHHYHQHPPTGHEDYGHVHYHPPTGSLHGGEYTAPSAPGPDFEPHHFSLNNHHNHHHHDGDKPPSPDDVHTGLLILKKIPSSHHNGGDHELYHHSTSDESKVPDFKPISSSGPSFGTIIGKFFRASTSLNPSEPAPFNDHDHYYQHDDHHHHHHHHDDLPEPTPTHEDTYSHSTLTEVQKSPPPTAIDSESLPPSSPGIDSTSSHIPSSPTIETKPPTSTGFGNFEATPNYVNHNDFSNHEIKKPHFDDGPSNLNPLSAFDEVRPLNGYPVDVNLPNSYGQPNVLIGNHAPINHNYPPINQNLPQQDGNTVHFGNSFNGGDFSIKQLSTNFDNFDSYFDPHSFDNAPSNSNKTPIKSSKSNKNKDYPRLSPPPLPVPHRKLPAARPPFPQPLSPPRTSTRSIVRTKRPYEIVESISYELGPNGPKRL